MMINETSENNYSSSILFGEYTLFFRVFEWNLTKAGNSTGVPSVQGCKKIFFFFFKTQIPLKKYIF